MIQSFHVENQYFIKVNMLDILSSKKPDNIDQNSIKERKKILPPSQFVCSFREKKLSYNIDVTFPIITLTIYYSLLSILSFIFPILFIKDSFVNELIVSLFRTILISFLNRCEMPKTSYNLGRRE